LNEIIKQFKDKKVLIWGDLILDEYIYTTTGRISREAPVLVTEFESNEFRLGGAGNVVMNIHSLGAKPIPVGFIGKDNDGRILKDILRENEIDTDFLVEADLYRTPKKSRILSGGENTKKQQVLRIDTLNKSNLEDSSQKNIEQNLLESLKDIELLIISDYIYKSVTPKTLSNIRKEYPQKIVIIDSRNNLTNFMNVTIATPNEPEIKRIFPGQQFYTDNDFFKAGNELLAKLNANGIVLKRGQKGMIAFEMDKQPRIVDIYGGTEIVDETGAGDTVIAVTSLAYFVGADLYNAAKLASIAAGKVVMKEGTYPVTLSELTAAVEGN